MMKYTGCVTFTYGLYVETCMQCLSWFFEWKYEVPIAEVSLLSPSSSEPLGDTTDTQVAKDQNDQT